MMTINHDQGLYVIESGYGGFSCLGFDNAERESAALASELGLDRSGAQPGTAEHYEEHAALVQGARQRYDATGERSSVALTPQLVGLEGRRVEVVDCYGETRRFYVGKSTGCMPCHLEIARRNALGGPAVTGAPFRSVRVLSNPSIGGR